MGKKWSDVLLQGHVWERVGQRVNINGTWKRHFLLMCNNCQPNGGPALMAATSWREIDRWMWSLYQQPDETRQIGQTMAGLAGCVAGLDALVDDVKARTG